MWRLPIDRIAIENPVGVLSTRWRKPDQIIQPYQLGDDASKATYLWLKRLDRITIDPRMFNYGRTVIHNSKLVWRWANQTDTGQNRLPPGNDRWKERSKTFEGFSNAFASTWAA